MSSMNYYELIEDLAPLNRCHNSPQMHKAYRKLVEHYEGSIIVETAQNEEINKWKVPPYWDCKSAKLVSEDGQIIADADVKDFDELYRFLYDNSDKYLPNKGSKKAKIRICYRIRYVCRTGTLQF